MQIKKKKKRKKEQEVGDGICREGNFNWILEKTTHSERSQIIGELCTGLCYMRHWI